MKEKLAYAFAVGNALLYLSNSARKRRQLLIWHLELLVRGYLAVVASSKR